jgi:polar amino acid transport system permease protein
MDELMQLSLGSNNRWRRVLQSVYVDISVFALIIVVLAVLFSYNTAALGYRWQWNRVPRFLITRVDGVRTLGPLLVGLGVTLRIVSVSLILSLIIALVTAIFRLSQSVMAQSIARIYLELIRNTPLIVQLFFMYFVIAPLVDMDGWTAAVIALSMFEGAYASEIIRGGIVSLPPGQWEAAYSIGLERRDALRYIILPQSIRRVLPPLVGQAISLIKDSALVSTIAIYDLTMRGQVIVAETFLAFEIWFVVAGIYLIITISLSVAVSLLRNKLEGTYEYHH